MKKDIVHEFQFVCSPETVSSALTQARHIQQWWTNDALIENGKGIFHWRGHGWAVEILFDKSVNNELVSWRCIKSNMQDTDAWEGSTIVFELSPTKLGTKLFFRHSGYKSSPCFETCHDGWNFVLGKSLKSYLETGKGMPYAPT